MGEPILTNDELTELEKRWKSDEMLQKMQDNWSTFLKWCDRLRDEQKEPIKQLLQHFEERMFIAPASSRLEYHNAFPGGYTDHSLRVLTHTIALAKAYHVTFDPSTIVMAALFHDFGKVGTLDEPYYIPETSDWHRKRGIMYNRNLKFPNAQLGLFTLQSLNVPLNFDEYYAILLNDGPNAPENKPYVMHEPKLALLLHQADRWATQEEKGRQSLLEPAVANF